MQDIDFDELDRAVSSLISDTPAAKTDGSAKTESTNNNIDSNAGSTPTPASTDSTPVSVNVTVNAAPAPLTPTPTELVSVVNTPTESNLGQTPSNIVSNRPNLGRSMDMVRPIGNNPVPTNPIKPTVLPNPSEVPSRKSMVISPISLTELPPTNNPADRNNNQPVVPIGGSLLEAAPIQNQQQDSPFIPDVKVDKRPLGGIEPDVPEQPKEQPPVYASAITPNGFINDKAEISTDMPLPAELQNKLLEIEAAESSSTSSPVIPNAPLAPVTPALKIEEAPKPIDTMVSETITPTVPNENKIDNVNPLLSGQQATATVSPQTTDTIPPTSISQQYANTTADDVNLKTTGAIYDTSAFNNKSNIKPAKKKNAWGWILAIVIILIGAAIGVGIYIAVR